jgi:hypothetical protein
MKISLHPLRKGWVQPRVVLDILENNKYLALPGIQPRFLGLPACNTVTIQSWLSHVSQLGRNESSDELKMFMYDPSPSHAFAVFIEPILSVKRSMLSDLACADALIIRPILSP